MPKQTILLFTPKKKYHRWYEALISRARKRQLEDYTEGHHAIPRSLGGTNEAFNIVELTFREHFICHWLLTKMTEGEAKRKMLRALHWMCNGNGGQKTLKTQRGVISSWRYDVARRAARDAQIGTKRPGLHDEKFKDDLSKRMKGNTFNKGKEFGPRSPEALENIRASWTKERRAEAGVRLKKNNPMHSPEVVVKIKTGWTEERRIRTGKRLSAPEVRAKVTVQNIGRKRPDTTARFKGKPRIMTEEHREKLRIRMAEVNRLYNPNEKRKGVPRSAEVRAKISAKKKGKRLSPEHIARIREGMKARQQESNTEMSGPVAHR